MEIYQVHKCGVWEFKELVPTSGKGLLAALEHGRRHHTVRQSRHANRNLSLPFLMKPLMSSWGINFMTSSNPQLPPKTLILQTPLTRIWGLIVQHMNF